VLSGQAALHRRLAKPFLAAVHGGASGSAAHLCAPACLLVGRLLSPSSLTRLDFSSMQSSVLFRVETRQQTNFFPAYEPFL